MDKKPSDWLLYGGLVVANAAGGIAAIGGPALDALAKFSGWAALAVAIGAIMKLSEM